MSDEAAIRLFEEAGNPAREWCAVDEVVRAHYRKLATREKIGVAMEEDVAEVARRPGFPSHYAL